jgi:methylthioribose-1-phosphate isomerase
MGMAMGLQGILKSNPHEGRENLREGFNRMKEILKQTRPTAVNLAWALERISRAFREADGGGTADQVRSVRREADAIAREDRAMCRSIAEFGLGVIPESGAGVLTHCNAGALATGGMGTALAPLYLAYARGIRVRVYADETRPLLQGARLTAWELSRAGIPVTVITDSMAAALMREGRVNLVMVGADRVAANGDVANKIGTYGLSVLAHHHGIPFYVALPRSTFDPATADGSSIAIEERSPSEVVAWTNRATAPKEAEVWNPAFDITPAHLVTAFVTDGGLLRPPFREAISSLCADSGEERK